MKKTILLCISLFSVAACFGQNTHSCDTVYLNNETNIKNADTCVLIAAEYVLTHPLHGNAQIYHDYRGFILAWMDKTPDYTFSLNEEMVSICKEDDNILLFGVYTTCLAKAAIQLKNNFNSKALKEFVDYIRTPDHKVKQTKKVRKLIEDFDAGRIDKYIS